MNIDPSLLLLAIPSGACLAITAIRWRYHVRQGARADAATALGGTIVADGDEPVLELVLELEIPYRKNGMGVEETHRELRVRPFMVKTDAGELIDVDPPRDVALHATLGKAQKIEHLRRYQKAAQVRVGQRVYLRVRCMTHCVRKAAPSVKATGHIATSRRRWSPPRRSGPRRGERPRMIGSGSCAGRS